MAQVVCQIEHHAILFALISKVTIEKYGEQGKEAILHSVSTYGNERGKRMAERAIARGDGLTLLASQAYGEWVPNYPGQMEFGIITGEPTLKTFISKCAWCEAWNKHDILDYGKLYCVDVDNAVFQGFNPEFLCTPLTKSLSFGGDVCEFDWGLALSEEDIKNLAKRKEELGTSCTRDFNFHAAHLLVSFTNSLQKEIGDESEELIKKAKIDFIEKFGEEYLNAIEAHKGEL